MSQHHRGTLSHKDGTLRSTLHKKAYETLGKEGIGASILCPEDVDLNEWIAVHAVDFYNDVNLIFSVVQDECTNYSCPIMSAGKDYEFLWADKIKYKRPTRLPAKMYIDYLMNWTKRCLEDETFFPVEQKSAFPADYRSKVNNIFRRLFRVYAHIYYSHLTLIKQLDLIDQFYFSITHFVYFMNEFSLISADDLRPLSSLVIQLVPDLTITQQLITSNYRREVKRKLYSSPMSAQPFSEVTSDVSYCTSSVQSPSACKGSNQSSPITGLKLDMMNCNSIQEMDTIPPPVISPEQDKNEHLEKSIEIDDKLLKEIVAVTKEEEDANRVTLEIINGEKENKCDCHII